MFFSGILDLRPVFFPIILDLKMLFGDFIPVFFIGFRSSFCRTLLMILLVSTFQKLSKMISACMPVLVKFFRSFN